MSTVERVRVGVVTGGSRGIGRAAVLELSRRGYAVVVNFREDAGAAEEACGLARELGAPEAIALRCDVSDLEAGRGLVASTVERLGRIDLWVNNAGVAPNERSDLLDASPESFDRVLGTNLRGSFFATQAAARVMIGQRQVAGETSGPRIVFITSVSSTFASTNRADYCISKAGLSMVARLFAVRLAEHGIGVFEVRPGIIETDMTRGGRAVYDQRLIDGLAPIRRWGRPEDVGRVVGMLADGELGYTTGEVFHVDGGLNLPRL